MKNGKNIRGVLSYNEAKVRKGEAELILASRFGCEASELSFSQKCSRFEKLIANCVLSTYNTVHISLNFHPDEMMDTEQMQAIARDYMQELGFEKQPYLVYRHTDAAHPHLHIVTTHIRQSGSTISLHNLVQRKSEPARKLIEESFGLIKAEGRKENVSLTDFSLDQVPDTKLATKQAISQVVRSVLTTYRFTSMEEYRLILLEFGVVADMGDPGTRLNRYHGMMYYLKDEKGGKKTVGIKASAIYDSPTITNVQTRFARNQIHKEGKMAYTKDSIRFCCKVARNRDQLLGMLYDKKLRLTKNRGGDLVIIDHRNKTVYSAKELGIEKELSAAMDWNLVSLMDGNLLPLSLLEQLAANANAGQELSPEFLKRKRRKRKK